MYTTGPINYGPPFSSVYWIFVSVAWINNLPFSGVFEYMIQFWPEM